jgi:Sec-independent protein translocase protein TatA
MSSLWLVPLALGAAGAVAPGRGPAEGHEAAAHRAPPALAARPLAGAHHYTRGVLDLSPEKIFLLGVIALVVLGPNRLPEAARSLGRAMAHLRRMSASFQAEVRDALAEPTEALTTAAKEFNPVEIRRTVRDAVSSTFAPIPASEPIAAPSPDATAAPDDPSLN